MIICGFTSGGLKETARNSFPPEVELLDFTGNDYAYWNAIRERWNGQEDIIVLEQDIEIAEDTIASLSACPEPWCSFRYTCVHVPSITSLDTDPVGYWIDDGLGCTKFSADLQSRFPIKGTHWDDNSIRHHWKMLDRHMSSMMDFNHVNVHVHGSVVHHHAYKDPRWAKAKEEFESRLFLH